MLQAHFASIPQVKGFCRLPLGVASIGSIAETSRNRNRGKFDGSRFEMIFGENPVGLEYFSARTCNECFLRRFDSRHGNETRSTEKKETRSTDLWSTRRADAIIPMISHDLLDFEGLVYCAQYPPKAQPFGHPRYRHIGCVEAGVVYPRGHSMRARPDGHVHNMAFFTGMHFRAQALDVVCASLACTAPTGKHVLTFVGPFDWGYAIAYLWKESRTYFLDFVDIEFI